MTNRRQVQLLQYENSMWKSLCISATGVETLTFAIAFWREGSTKGSRESKGHRQSRQVFHWLARCKH